MSDTNKTRLLDSFTAPKVRRFALSAGRPRPPISLKGLTYLASLTLP